MAVSFSPYAAYNARVRMNNTTLVANKWTVNVKVDDIDATNFEGLGFGEQITGVVSADVTIEFLYDPTFANDNNFTFMQLVPSMSIGTYDFTNVKLFPNAIDNAASSFTFPRLTGLGVNTDVDVHGALRVSITGKSDGVFTYPS